jgi:hypothetical protein
MSLLLHQDYCMNIHRLLFLLFLFPSLLALGQDSLSGEKRNIRIISDPKVIRLTDVYKQVNAESQKMPGYRVQLFYGSDRKRANEVKSEFLRRYPEVAAYLVYQQPNYKVRVGDFRTRLEAYELYRKLLPDFSSSFIVTDDIKLPPLD